MVGPKPPDSEPSYHCWLKEVNVVQTHVDFNELSHLRLTQKILILCNFFTLHSSLSHNPTSGHTEVMSSQLFSKPLNHDQVSPSYYLLWASDVDIKFILYILHFHRCTGGVSQCNAMLHTQVDVLIESVWTFSLLLFYYLSAGTGLLTLKVNSGCRASLDCAAKLHAQP